MPAPDARPTFWTATQTALAGGHLAKLTLAKPRRKDPAKPRNLYARVVEIGGEEQLQITHRYADREEVKNFEFGAAIDYLRDWLDDHFGAAELFTTEQHYSLKLSRKGHARLQVLGERRTVPLTTVHNRVKYRDIPASRPYLHALGITTAEGKITNAGRRKFKQINKFVEIMDNLLRDRDLPPRAHVVDMGSGSGYLTFALYDHLTGELGMDVRMTGVEIRPNLVDKCNRIARENRFADLQFIEGSIDTFDTDSIEVLIALHACDTATDDALKAGADAGAEVMVVAPCCQKQVRRDMEVPADLRPLLGNGILLERQAAMLTDGLRALYLEQAGYKTKLFEFIPLEHTAKNVMITAERGTARAEAGAEARTLRERFGVRRHRLAELFGVD